MSQIKPIEEVKNNLMKMESQFQMVLPPQIPAERFIRVAMTAVQTSPSLLECNRQSLYAACVKAAQDGLLPDGKEAALVPFKGVVQYLPMVGGILKKIRNSGELVSIGAHVVYERDEFTYWIDDDGEHLKHQPFFGDGRGNPRLVYAIAKTRDGGVYIEVMTTAQVEQVRAVSRAKDGPWVTWWTEMAKKTVIRRLAKRLPMSTDLEGVIEHDNEGYDLQPAEEPKAERRSRMESIVDEAEVIDTATGEITPVVTSMTATEVKSTTPANYKYLQAMQTMKTAIGEEWYYKILKEVGGAAHCNEIIDKDKQKQIYNEMKKFMAATKEVDNMEATRLAAEAKTDETNKGDII